MDLFVISCMELRGLALPPGIGSAQVLPGIIAGNPQEVGTLPSLFVTMYPGIGEYAHVPLAHRVDIDRLYGLMKMSPEWSDVVCHGSFGEKYKQKTWEHMSPFEIRATFVPDISTKCWSEDLVSSLDSKRGTSGIIAEGLRNAGALSVILGITDNWEAGERISTSGAKLYIRSSNADDTASRNYALARAAARHTHLGNRRKQRATDDNTNNRREQTTTNKIDWNRRQQSK